CTLKRSIVVPLLNPRRYEIDAPILVEALRPQHAARDLPHDLIVVDALANVTPLARALRVRDPSRRGGEPLEARRTRHVAADVGRGQEVLAELVDGAELALAVASGAGVGLADRVPVLLDLEPGGADDGVGGSSGEVLVGS